MPIKSTKIWFRQELSQRVTWAYFQSSETTFWFFRFDGFSCKSKLSDVFTLPLAISYFTWDYFRLILCFFVRVRQLLFPLPELEWSRYPTLFGCVLDSVDGYFRPNFILLTFSRYIWYSHVLNTLCSFRPAKCLLRCIDVFKILAHIWCVVF